MCKVQNHQIWMLLLFYIQHKNHKCILYNSIITTTHDIYIQQYHYDYTWHIYTTVSLRLHMTYIYISIVTTTHDIYTKQYYYDYTWHLYTTISLRLHIILFCCHKYVLLEWSFVLIKKIYRCFLQITKPFIDLHPDCVRKLKSIIGRT